MNNLLLVVLMLCMPFVYSDKQVQNKVETVNVNGIRITLKNISATAFNNLKKSIKEVKLTHATSEKKNGFLKLQLDNGKVLSYKNVANKETENKKYSLLGMFDNKFFVLDAEYYENDECLLINKKDGSITHLWSVPIMSQDEKHFFTFSGALGDDIVPNGIQLFNFSNGKPTLNWEYKINDWEPTSVAWLNPNTLLVSKHVSEDLSKTGKEIKEYLEITW